MDVQPAGLCEKGAMVPLRKEIEDFSRSCERLIIAATSLDETPFTSEEIAWVNYYVKEMANLVDQLSRNTKPQVQHERQSMQDYADANEAVLALKNLSNGERQSIQESVKDIRNNILNGPESSESSP
jgi:hypothetical protein